MNRITSYIRQSLQNIYPPEEVKALSMLIYCDILGLDALDIYMGKDITLSECKQRELENILFRMRKNEPIQYICGMTKFGGLEFKVAPGVLIPRPETLEMVELIVDENPSAQRILDIGTGSGCIAISLAKKLPAAEVDAWDVSEKALFIAKQNSKALNASVDFRQQDVFSDEGLVTLVYDIIVSNPPYITESEKQQMDANVLDWEPAQALFVPDEDPLRFYRRIIRLGERLLAPGGKLYFEINQAYGQQTTELLEMNQYQNVRVIKDVFGKERIVTANR